MRHSLRSGSAATEVVLCNTGFSVVDFAQGVETRSVLDLDPRPMPAIGVETPPCAEYVLDSRSTAPRGLLSTSTPSCLLDTQSVFGELDPYFFHRSRALLHNAASTKKRKWSLAEAMSDLECPTKKRRLWNCIQTEMVHRELDGTATGFGGKKVAGREDKGIWSIAELLESYPGKFRVVEFANK